MKKIFLILCTLLTFFLLSACNKSNVITNEETTTELSETDKRQQEWQNEKNEIMNSVNEENAEYKGKCGAYANWYYKDNTLVIKGKGSVIEDWKDYLRENHISLDIKTVVIDDNISEMYPGTFMYSNVENVYWSNGMDEITRDAFFNCYQLKEIYLPCNVKKIGNSAFMGCRNLEKIENSEHLEKIGDLAFALCKQLKEITISNNAEIGEQAFYENTGVIKK